MWQWMKKKSGVVTTIESTSRIKVPDGFWEGKTGMDILVCPNCGCDQFYEGAEGGGAQNVKCSGCLYRYNNTPFGLYFNGVTHLPRIKQNLTGESEEFPTEEGAVEEALSRNKLLFPTTTAQSLELCEYWYALDENGTLLTDMVGMWKAWCPGKVL